MMMVYTDICLKECLCCLLPSNGFLQTLNQALHILDFETLNERAAPESRIQTADVELLLLNIQLFISQPLNSN